MQGRDDIVQRVLRTRRATERLVEPLAVEDMVVQSMPDASPAKWHLAHTTWFFERFVLRGLGIPPVNEAYDYVFNSYYESVGQRHPRARRGILSRPTVSEVMAYRRAVDARLADLEGGPSHWRASEVDDALELGIHHEEQHQELILTDIKHLFGSSPLEPVYARGAERAKRDVAPLTWRAFEGGLYAIGHDGAGFAFDNERPSHDVHLRPFAMASRLVTCGEWAAFIADGGYARAELWLSEGWDWVRSAGARAPLYWNDAQTKVFTLSGARPIDQSEPVTHVTYFEADAYARWAGARLPTEAEWEVASKAAGAEGAFAPDGPLHPMPAAPGSGLAQMFGDAWEWTASAYAPYPGFRPLAGAFGEYNGKFMVSQLVLRGGSCATPRGHVRPTYRNFFHPGAQWQFSGIRLARDS